MDKKQIDPADIRPVPADLLMIEDQADLIRVRVKNQRIFGVPVDPENEDMMLCAAFFLGRQAASSLLLQYEPYHRFGPSEYKKGDEK